MICGSHPNLTLNHALNPSNSSQIGGKTKCLVQREKEFHHPASLPFRSIKGNILFSVPEVCKTVACKRFKIVYSFHHLNPRHLPSDRRMLLRDLQHSFYACQWIIVDVLPLILQFLKLTLLLFFVCACWGVSILLQTSWNQFFTKFRILIQLFFPFHFFFCIYFWPGCSTLSFPMVISLLSMLIFLLSPT